MGAMDFSKMKKPENLRDDTWEQHLDWLNVMGKQVDENFDKHKQRARQDVDRNSALAKRHQEVLKRERRTHSLFCTYTQSIFSD